MVSHCSLLPLHVEANNDNNKPDSLFCNLNSCAFREKWPHCIFLFFLVIFGYLFLVAFPHEGKNAGTHILKRSSL